MWNPDDTRLISCSMDGAIYEWNVQSFKRERECVLKTCSYTSVALTPDLRTTFAVGNDHTLKEIILQDSNVSKDKYVFNRDIITVYRNFDMPFHSLLSCTVLTNVCRIKVYTS